MQYWQTFKPQVWSSYQRLYFFSNAYARRTLSSEHQQQLGKVLKGFTFRHLAALFNQDELVLAKRLHPLIVNGAILLRDPQPPFNLLPKLPSHYPVEAKSLPKEGAPTKLQSNFNLGERSPLKSDQKNPTIVFVDDSKTILSEIKRFLENDFAVIAINDPLTALLKIIQIKPDLILLDIGMPNLDGHLLCSMLRKSSLFKTTPIIMVTGKKGLIDRARAKLAGANDYITKPFTQSELIDMVSRYLS